MIKMRELAKKTAFRVFVILAPIVFAAVFVLNYALFTNKSLQAAMDDAFGGEKFVVSKGDPSDYAYYETEYSSKSEVLAAADEYNVRICEEGIVLLKNDGALPLKCGARISVFGKNSADVVLGGSGTSAVSGGHPAGLYESLSEKFTLNPILTEFYESSDSGKGRPLALSLAGSIPTGLSTGETPLELYPERVWKSCNDYADAALVVISRLGGEGFDLPRSMKNGYETDATAVFGARDPSDHYLMLDANEAALVKKVGELFDVVIIVLNSPSAMEVGFLDDDSHYAYSKNVKGALWIGFPGGAGLRALASVLCGEVNPSGRLVDTYARDFTVDPSYRNFADNNALNGNRYTSDGKSKPYYYVEYEEGIYVGYRYYETRGVTESEKGNADWYKNNVVYPFGYGLSYTQFEWEIVDIPTKHIFDADDIIEIKVRVTNVGAVAGKDVVQLYCSPPYTTGGIEKPHVTLCAYQKTNMLYPHAQADKDKPCSQSVTLAVRLRDLASYDYSDANGNGFKGYELEKGKYTLYIGRDAHGYADNDCLSFAFNVNEDIEYRFAEPTKREIGNLFDDVSNGIRKYMSRADFEETFPLPPTVAEREKSAEFFDGFNYEREVGQKEDHVPVESELKLYELIGVDFEDGRWVELVNSLSVAEMKSLVASGNYGTARLDRIYKPSTIDADGAVGFVRASNSAIYDTCFYASPCVLAASFNSELANGYGKMVGDEALVGNEKGDNRPYNGWYAPAVNIHRSPFAGRNWEYCSEDGYLTGMTAASVVSGARSKGIVTYVKHFALNDQETNRSSNGLAVWANEQAMREIYFKPFELCVKLGKTTAIMSSFNRIGTVWAGGDERLLSDLLRGEWGFCGTVVTDYNASVAYMDAEQMLCGGGDLCLCKTRIDSNNAQITAELKRAAKNILYTVANSNAMNGLGDGIEYRYKRPLWHICMIIADVFIAVALVIWGVFAVIYNKNRGYKNV